MSLNTFYRCCDRSVKIVDLWSSARCRMSWSLDRIELVFLDDERIKYVPLDRDIRGDACATRERHAGSNGDAADSALRRAAHHVETVALARAVSRIRMLETYVLDSHVLDGSGIPMPLPTSIAWNCSSGIRGRRSIDRQIADRDVPRARIDRNHPRGRAALVTGTASSTVSGPGSTGYRHARRGSRAPQSGCKCLPRARDRRHRP